jgi:integrase
MKAATVRQEIPDDMLRGHYLIVQPSGVKSWAIRYRHHGISRKYTIGTFPRFDLKTARERARDALRSVEEGRDPANEKAESKKVRTAEELCREFIDNHCKHNNRSSTVYLVELALQNHVLPAWRGRVVTDITRDDIKSLLRKIAVETPAAANRLHAIIRKMFNYAFDEGLVKESPCVRIAQITKHEDRDRVLSDSELRSIWIAADQVGYPFGSVVKVLVLTGQRRNEVAEMRWSELDLDRGIWTLPAARCKNGKSHEVQLAPQVVKILRSVPRMSDYVFSYDGGHSPLTMSSNLKDRIDVSAKVEDWRLHDLRRSAASGMAKLGIGPHIIDKILNHTNGAVRGVAAIYNRHDYGDERRKALATWADHIYSL